MTVPLSLESLLRDSAIDAELGALASMLVEARVPVIVAGDIDPSIRARVLDAFLGALPDDVRRVELAGPTEDFAWLPEAESLGWRSDGPTPGRPAIEPATAESTVILAGDLATEAARCNVGGRRPHRGSGGLAGIRLRWDHRGAVAGGRPGATARHANATHRGRAVAARAGRDRGGPGRCPERLPRVVAAHYLRPVARDMHGHVQKLGPAVLATWDGRAGRFEHFGWGVTPELAMRTGRHAGDFEIELERRREALERGAT